MYAEIYALGNYLNLHIHKYILRTKIVTRILKTHIAFYWKYKEKTGT